MRKIYTTENIRVTGVAVHGMSELPPKMRAWVESSRRKLVAEATLPEKIAARRLESFDERPVRQAFFLIRRRCYFLDFFFPRRMLAVEIDGSVHKLKKEHDRRRDADFRSIGIRTIRIKNTDVMQGKLMERLMRRLYG